MTCLFPYVLRPEKGLHYYHVSNDIQTLGLPNSRVTVRSHTITLRHNCQKAVAAKPALGFIVSGSRPRLPTSIFMSVHTACHTTQEALNVWVQEAPNIPGPLKAKRNTSSSDRLSLRSGTRLLPERPSIAKWK